MALSFDKVNKIITVLSPDTEITIQNLLNSIRRWEDDLSSMDLPKIVSCAGKEPLGGGVVVGLTLTLLDDWQLAFEARGGPSYTQCIVSGGNIVATNANGSIYPTAFTQVLITASSSATQSDLAAIQYSSYQNAVWLDPTTSTTGTVYPKGTREVPVNNILDAIIIANDKGFDTIQILQSITLGSDLEVDSTGPIVLVGFTLVGKSHVNTQIVLGNSVVCDHITIKNCNVTGVLDGGTHIMECVAGDLMYVNGHIHDSGVYGTITLAGSDSAVLANCYTIDQDNPLIVDMGGSGQDLSMPNYSGIVTITNLHSASEEVGIGLNAGMVTLDSTVTAGTLIISGVGLVYNNSTGTAIVNTDGLMSKDTIARAVWDEPIANHLVSGSTGLSVGIAQYGGYVHIDVENGVSGTTFPIGTENTSVNNLADAITIAEFRGILGLHFHGNFTFKNTDSISGYELRGESYTDTTFTFEYGSITANCKGYNATITGMIFGLVEINGCVIDNYTNSGLAPSSATSTIINCLIKGNVTIPSNYTGKLQIINCQSVGTAETGDSTILNAGGANFTAIFKQWSGPLGFTNATHASSQYAIDMTSGKINLMSSVTKGNFRFAGVGTLINNSVEAIPGDIYIDSEGLMSKETVSEAIWDEPIGGHLISGTTGETVDKINKNTKLLPALL